MLAVQRTRRFFRGERVAPWIDDWTLVNGFPVEYMKLCRACGAAVEILTTGEAGSDGVRLPLIQQRDSDG